MILHRRAEALEINVADQNETLPLASSVAGNGFETEDRFYQLLA
jgi:hypothetical protein